MGVARRHCVQGRKPGISPCSNLNACLEGVFMTLQRACACDRGLFGAWMTISNLLGCAAGRDPVVHAMQLECRLFGVCVLGMEGEVEGQVRVLIFCTRYKFA